MGDGGVVFSAPDNRVTITVYPRFGMPGLCKHSGRIAVLAAAFALYASISAIADDNPILNAGPAQPQNVGDAILAATAYHESGAYDRDFAQVAAKASAWISERAPAVSRPAVVFDVDETVLSNWEVIVRDNFGRPIQGECSLAVDGPCGWAAWDDLAADPPLGPALEVYKAAIAAKATVFFITGRPENQRKATEANLRAAGFTSYEALHLAPNGVHFSSAVNFKTPVRAGIESAGYTIIANIGDQPSDLLGGHAERLFQLPNPFYRVP
jgi:predicted secreted acid phosphatase